VSESVIFIKVDKPVFDLAGVILSSLGLTAICAGIALVLGTVLGYGLIVQRRRTPPDVQGPVTLHLIDHT
jgi:hypothetical protein